MQKDWIRNQKLAARQERQERMAAMRATRTPNGSSFDRSPGRSPIPSQILSYVQLINLPQNLQASPAIAAIYACPARTAPRATIHANGTKDLHERHASRNGMRSN